MTDELHENAYLRACNGRLKGILRWPELDAVWARLRQGDRAGWYVYTVGRPPPTTPASAEELERFLAEIRQRLLEEHREDYCGIVYVDDFDAPGFVKIYDPGNLGMVCGSSDVPTLPGWTLSRAAPVDLDEARRPPRQSGRWWRKLLGTR
jgi:hypothetical protein